MGFSAICFSHKYLLIRNIYGKSEEIVQKPFNIMNLMITSNESGTNHRASAEVTDNLV